MGVYIKDMEKPKKCENCQFYMAFYIGNKKVGSACELTDDVKSIEVKQDDCPLIEIGDIEYQAYKEFRTMLLKKIEDRILYGERRSDGDI